MRRNRLNFYILAYVENKLLARFGKMFMLCGCTQVTAIVVLLWWFLPYARRILCRTIEYRFEELLLGTTAMEKILA